MVTNTKDLINDVKHRMDNALTTLDRHLKGLRTGRASASLLEPVVVEAYGNKMPLNQVGTVNVPEPRMITVQVWDRGMASAVEKAIRESGLGLNPVGEGALIRVPVPALSEERRKEMGKVVAKYGEEAKVAVRNVRRDGMDGLKKLEKDGLISEDEQRGKSDDIQKITDEHVKKVDEMTAAKEKEIMDF